jgi:hypothetical protein
MQLSLSANAANPRNLLTLAMMLLLVAGVFGALNNHKLNNLRSDVANADAARDAAERRRATEQKEIKAREASAAAASAKLAETETRATKAETDLAAAQKEKNDLQGQLEKAQIDLTTSQKRADEAGAKPPEANPGAASVPELQAQLEEARKSLENAEHEKALLMEKMSGPAERTAKVAEEPRRREPNPARLGVRGTVLAVNQAYNFVVLNLGGRHGVEANSEMLVVRSGEIIAKIRISSVEPSTAIADIITGSLARGVQVQPGDIVIYAGSNS